MLALQELYSSASQELHGSVHAAHQWVNMTDETVPFNSTHTVSAFKETSSRQHVTETVHRTWNTSMMLTQFFCTQGRTCKPALGHSFAAGTTDGGGEFNFVQGKEMCF